VGVEFGVWKINSQLFPHMYIDLENITPQRDPSNTASAFAKWVYDIHHPRERTDSEYENNKEEKRKERGILSHRRINLFFDLRSTKKYLDNADRSQWDLDYRDESPESPILKCSSLKIGDKPMRCKPDVVLKHKNTGSILIIEHKTTYISIDRLPEDGWPNVQAQLWCYSWIDKYLEAPDVQLFGWIWHDRGFKARNFKAPGRFPFKWSRGDKKHHEYCKGLYKHYGGKFIQM